MEEIFEAKNNDEEALDQDSSALSIRLNKKTKNVSDEEFMEKACTHCGIHEKKIRTDEEKKALLNRLKRAEGQVKGIERMIENNAYCPDVIMQSSAAINALNSFNKALLACHIKNCVADDIRAGNDETIDELTNLVQKLMK